ncbi:mitotic spindle assembly checkpoint protein MAD2B [Ceratobasidium sp. AG-Ba]|nr:mitotic spindle assembly checkpoint protein MAD2B [Ceratobasidium sp. AG-Ba]
MSKGRPVKYGGITVPGPSASRVPIAERGLTFNQTVKEIVEFLEVAIHTILFIRGVYPPDLFVRRRKWDAPVYQSRHPALNEYIAGAVSAVKDELLMGSVERMIVVIKDRNDVALERFIFSLKVVVEPAPIEMNRWDKDTVIKDALPLLSLPQHFRSFLVKLSLVEGQLGDLPQDEDMSFGVLLELKDDAVPSASPQSSQDPPPWIAASNQHTSAGTSDDAQLRVIRALETGVIDVGLAVQESGEKLAGLKSFGKRAVR